MFLSNLLQSIASSFHSADLYRAAARHGQGTGFAYLAMVLALCWLPSPVWWTFELRTFANTTGRSVAGQLPTITIDNGVMTSMPGGRHEIRVPDLAPEEDVRLIIDDTIDTVPADLKGELLVLTRKQAGQIRSSRNDRRIWDLSGGSTVTVTPADARAFIDSLPFWMPAVAYAVCLAASLAFRMGQVALYAAIAQAMASRAGGGLDYLAAMRLAAVAVTPVVAIRTLLWLGPWEPDWYVRWPLAAALTLAYLRFGVRAALAEEAGSGRVDE